MAYLGDYALNQQVDFLFTSRDSTGVPSTLSGAVLSIYRDGGTTEFTTGLSLTTDFDARVGLNRCLVDTSNNSANFLEGHDFNVVFTAGQVSPLTVVGEVAGQFSISNRFGGALLYGKLAANGTTSQLSLPSVATVTNDIYNGAVIVGLTGPGMGQARSISDYTGAGGINNAQLDAALTTAFTSATTVAVFPSPVPVAGSVNSIVPGAYSGVTVGAGNITPGTYSGVTVGVNNVGPQDLSSVFTVGVGIATPSVVTVRLSPMDYSSVVTMGAGIATPSKVTVQVQATSVVSADIRKINNVTVNGDGSTTSWGP